MVETFCSIFLFFFFFVFKVTILQVLQSLNEKFISQIPSCNQTRTSCSKYTNMCTRSYLKRGTYIACSVLVQWFLIFAWNIYILKPCNIKKKCRFIKYIYIYIYSCGNVKKEGKIGIWWLGTPSVPDHSHKSRKCAYIIAVSSSSVACNTVILCGKGSDEI